MNDLIDREKAIEDLQNRDPSKLYDIEDIEYWINSLPSIEPETPSNGSITSMNTEKMHDRTTDGLIRRQDVLHELEGCDYELKDWQRWKLKTMVRDIPSAEKAQLSEEDATSVCKCPCEYREPCDYCPYHRHGCPAEEGLKDE